MKDQNDRKPRPKRRDPQGRAYRGSQLHIQVWANCRRYELTRRVTSALGISAQKDLTWVSPIAPTFSEYRDGAFLRALELDEHRGKLKEFWPKGGPVWDALALGRSLSGAVTTVVLVEAKSYPREVHGSGCLATPGSKARHLIEEALDDAANWLGVSRPKSWTGKLYQSANRLAHLFFLREKLHLDAFMINVCFENDPRRPTSAVAWEGAIQTFRQDLGISNTPTPWLADIVLPAGDRAELLSIAI